MTFEEAQFIVSDIRYRKYNIRDLLVKDSKERKFVLDSLKELENTIWELAEEENKQ